MMDDTQRRKIAALLAQEQVATLITHGDEYPTGTMQAFAETEGFDLLFIMGDGSEKFKNLIARPRVTVLVDTRDVGKVETFDITRASIHGTASEVPRDGGEWQRLKDLFLKKNPFEQPFFGHPTLRMIRVEPRSISYSAGLRDNFKVEL